MPTSFDAAPSPTARHEPCGWRPSHMPASSLVEPGRRTGRVIPSQDILVRVQGSELRIELHDLSLGGFAIRCPRPFHTGMTHRFIFTVPSDGRSATLVAKAVHSHASNLTGDLKFVIGWEFMSARSQEDQAAISRLFLAATEPHPDVRVD